MPLQFLHLASTSLVPTFVGSTNTHVCSHRTGISQKDTTAGSKHIKHKDQPKSSFFTNPHSGSIQPGSLAALTGVTAPQKLNRLITNSETEKTKDKQAEKP